MAFNISSIKTSHLLLHHDYQPRSSVKPCATITISRRSCPIVSPKLAHAIDAKPPSLAASWREIQGSDDWEGLIEPLNPILRDEILRYGEFTLTCYKAFDLDHTSNHYLDCMYEKSNILKETGLSSFSYEVTKYIYATPDTMSAPRWIGYVAVSSDQEVARLGRRDIVVSFRGTITGPEWIANFMSSLTPAMLDRNDPRPDLKVESGFLSMYTCESSCRYSHGSCREQLLAEVSRIVNKYKDSESELSITLAGHSMGSSLALLLGYDLAELGIYGEVPITVYSFGGPRVGNSRFKERCEELGVKVLRVVNVNDPVTKLPGVLLNENCRVLGGKYELPWSCACYAHVGVELALNWGFKMRNPVRVHDLDAYLGLLACPAGKMSNGSDFIHRLMKKMSNGVMKKLIASTRFDAHCWGEVAARTARNLVQALRIFELTPWIQSR